MPPVRDQDYRILESPGGRRAGRQHHLHDDPGHPRREHDRGECRHFRAPVPGRHGDHGEPERQQREQPGDRGRASHGRRAQLEHRGIELELLHARAEPAELGEQRVVGRALELTTRLPRVQEDDALDARLAELLEAAEARPQRREAVRAVERVSEPRGLQDRVLLGMHADAHVVGRAGRVLLAVGAAVAAPLALVAARKAARRPVVARGDDALLAHDHRADVAAHALRALARRDRDQHEVLVPVRPAAAVADVGLTRVAAHRASIGARLHRSYAPGHG